jgi:hypothetical protein
MSILLILSFLGLLPAAGPRVPGKARLYPEIESGPIEVTSMGKLNRRSIEIKMK